MNEEALIIQATDIARKWGGVSTPPRLIKNRENIVFEVLLKSGDKGALRFHRPGYQTSTAINSELLWMEALAKRNFPCPAPIRTLHGNLTVDFNKHPTTSLISWIDAHEIGKVISENPGDPNISLFSDLGRLIAKLHNVTDQIETKTFKRNNWNEAGFIGDNPLWGKFWENPSLTPTEAELLNKIRQTLRPYLKNITNKDFGLIHADLLQENILKDSNELWIIDFDDSGFGFREYDLACALVQHIDNPLFLEIQSALIESYNDNRVKFDTNPKAVNLFIMLRSLASCGWISSRVPITDERQRFYANKALKCIEKFITGFLNN